MTNPELIKLSNAAQKAYGHFKNAMRRYGLTEKAMQESNFDPATLNPVCRALYEAWQEAEVALGKECAEPSQPPLGLDEGASGGGASGEDKPGSQAKPAKRPYTRKPKEAE